MFRKYSIECLFSRTLCSPPAPWESSQSIIPGVPLPWDSALSIQGLLPAALPGALANHPPVYFLGAFIVLRKAQRAFLTNGYFPLTISASHLVTEGKFSPCSHNYFLTLSPLFHLLNYVELFSLLFSKNASSVQCKNIYYLLFLYLLTFSFQDRKEKGSAVSSLYC